MEKIKYRNDDRKQLDLGVKVTVDAYYRMKKTKTLCDAVDRALKKLDVREVAILPRSESIQRHVRLLVKAVNEGKRPEGTRGWQVVLREAFDKITGGQQSIVIEKPESQEDVSVQALCPQEEIQYDEADPDPEDELTPEELEEIEVDDSWSDTNPPDVVKKPVEQPSGKNEKAERMHQMVMSHTALIMGTIQLECDSWHLEDDKVTMVMPYDTWYDICLHYGLGEEETKWASQS